MSTNSPEEAHEEALVPPPEQLKESDTGKDAGKEPTDSSSPDPN